MSRNSSWRGAAVGAVASGALAAGLLVGVGAAPALAEPVADTTETADAPEAPQVTPDQALLAISQKYDTGAGGGKLSNLIHDVMRLRQQGYMPSNSNAQELIEALDKGPSQAAMIEALQATLTTQLRNQMRAQAAQSEQSSTIGINTLPPGNHGSNLPPG